MTLPASPPAATAMAVLRNGRSALLCALLALVAVLGMTGASGWHSASFHDDGASQTASMSHDHGDSHHEPPASGDDSTSPIHVAAHAIGHSVDLPTLDAAPVRWTRLAFTYDLSRVPTLSGRDPASLLRPPRG